MQDMTKVLLVGVNTGKEQDFEHSMEELKSLAEEISRQSSIDFDYWLFVPILMQIHNEKEQVEQGKIQNV